MFKNSYFESQFAKLLYIFALSQVLLYHGIFTFFLMEQQVLILIYGIVTSYYAYTAWLFYKRRSPLHNMVATLMLTLFLQCVKNIVLIFNDLFKDPFYWNLSTAIDMIAVPLFVFILHYLLHTERLTVRRVVLHLAPFVLLIGAFAIFKSQIIFLITLIWAAIYGTLFFVLSWISIAPYQRRLKEQFSYSENISLKWLKTIPIFFYTLLGLWTLNCISLQINFDIIYMCFSLALWIVIGYFLYKHELVLEDLYKELPIEPVEASIDAIDAQSDLSNRITALFTDRKIYLNPNLKISDVAREVGSNRTYVSKFFNHEAGSTFYDYVNNLRVAHACQLLKSSAASIAEVAEHSGFNSPQAFIRVFVRTLGITPSEYRKQP